MRKHKSTDSYTPCTLTVPESKCAECENRLLAASCVRGRAIDTLTGKYQLVLKDKFCDNPDCTQYNRLLRPPGESELPLLERRAFGLDVVAWIGEERTLGKRSQPEIHTALREDYGISISQRHVAYLYQVYLGLVHCVNADAAPLREKIVEQGKIALSVDAVFFDDTSPGLYVLRDVISRRVLYSERVPMKDAEHLRPILRKVKDIGVPVIGVVSDKESSQVLAVEQELPGVPHQYCQTHFLKNVVKHMDSDLATLSEAVHEAVTNVKSLERDLLRENERQIFDGLAKADVELALTLCQAARVGGKVSGDTILHPAALKRFERLEYAYKAAEQAVESRKKEQKEAKKKTQTISPFLISLVGALSILQSQAALARRLRRQVEMVRKVAHILKFECPSSQIKRLLSTYLNQLLQLAAAQDPRNALGQFIHHLNGVADRYWRGLFHCYDVPELPPNNNDEEQFFGRFKRSDRKATGRKSTAGGPLETCAEFVLEAFDAIHTMPNLKDLLAEVSDDRLRDAMKEIERISEPARNKRRCQRDPEGFISEALEKWKTS